MDEARDWTPDEKESEAFNKAVREMYEAAVNSASKLVGYSTCGIDVESPEGLLKLAQAIRAKSE